MIFTKRVFQRGILYSQSKQTVRGPTCEPVRYETPLHPLPPEVHLQPIDRQLWVRLQILPQTADQAPAQNSAEMTQTVFTKRQTPLLQ